MASPPEFPPEKKWKKMVSFYGHFDDMPVKYRLLISQVEENWKQAM